VFAACFAPKPGESYLRFPPFSTLTLGRAILKASYQVIPIFKEPQFASGPCAGALLGLTCLPSVSPAFGAGEADGSEGSCIFVSCHVYAAWPAATCGGTFVVGTYQD
jgi:hypothetical protein